MNSFKSLSLVLTLFCIGFFTTSDLHAQSSSKLPHWEVRASLGLLPTFLKDHTSSELLPVSLEVRYRASQKFSVGLLAGTSISEANLDHHNGESRKVRNEFQMMALRGAIHANPFEKWDIYGGIILGYTNSNVEYTDITDQKDSEPGFFPQPRERNGLLFSGFVGTSYQLTNRVNFFGELGYGLSLATTGVAVRF